ncbi:MAG: helix-hairpin-helix domain-containing protein [Acidimicrobiia bacterium]
MSDEQEFWNRKHDDAAESSGPRPIPRGAFTARPPSVVQRVLDRLQDWRSDSRFGIVVLVVVAVVAGVVWYRIGIGGGSDAGAAPRKSASAARTPATTALDPVTNTSSSGTSSSGTSSSGTSSSGTSSSGGKVSARIAVHVAGAVTRPGVVELPARSRVIDAVEAVGGANADADLDRLNLAATLADGQRVYVPKVGQSDPGVVADGGGSPATEGGPSGGATTGGKLNLNTATQAQLEDLPGIGPTYAQAIIAERQRRGGFTSVNELRSVRGIGDKRFADLAPLVTV